MADDTQVDNKEPATTHDVGEGTTIGAVGGAIVGGLAGGPVGAVIGAVAGGVVSAGAVDVIDKHDNDYERTMANHTTRPTHGSAGTGGYSDYEPDYRAHHQTNYAGTGSSYEDYAPAYQYGHGLASDTRYQGRDWDAVESDAKADWESRSPNSWDRFKGSVRHSYDHAKSKL